MKKKHPQSLMMSFGHRPNEHKGAIKCPIYQSSTFVFPNAEIGKRQFELAYGLDEAKENDESLFIYSRLNNPTLEVCEKRLALWDKAEDCALFASGMAAITTAFFSFLKPGDLLLHSHTLYGGTSHFIAEILPKLGVKTLSFSPNESKEQILRRLAKSGEEANLKMIYAETPCNPTLELVDISMLRDLADESISTQEIIVAIDNTNLGPVWQEPLSHGADLVLYSATKYIAGHSDVVAGVCLGKASLMQTIRTMRTFLGNMTDPNTAWLVSRSLETLKVRMDQQAKNAQKVAEYLQDHPLVEKLYFPGLLRPTDGGQYEILKRQCLAGGAMISFDIKGGENEAFEFLNGLKLIKLAVSLGSTESLAEHPASMTHAGVPKEERQAHGITDKMIRLSIGLEHYEDIINDIKLGFSNIRNVEKGELEFAYDVFFD